MVIDGLDYPDTSTKNSINLDWIPFDLSLKFIFFTLENHTSLIHLKRKKFVFQEILLSGVSIKDRSTLVREILGDYC